MKRRLTSFSPLLVSVLAAACGGVSVPGSGFGNYSLYVHADETDGNINNPAGRASYNHDIAMGNAGGFASPAALPNDEFRHLAVTLDGMSLRTYHAGSVVSSLDDAAAPIQNTDQLRIGLGPLGSFRGRIDEIRIYNRALEPTEVEALAGSL